MKKVILLFLVLFASFGLVACVDGVDGATLEWETMPKSVYEKTEMTPKVLEDFTTSVTVKINGVSVSLANAISKNGVTLTGFDLSSPGSKQLVVKFESLTITWDYTVEVGELKLEEIVPDTSWYDNNLGNDTFTLNSIRDLYGLAKLVNDGRETFEGKTVKLGVEIDLSDKVWTPIGQGTRKQKPVEITGTSDVNPIMEDKAKGPFVLNRDYEEGGFEYIYTSSYMYAVRPKGLTNYEDKDIKYFSNKSDVVASDGDEGQKFFFRGTFDGQNHKIKGLSDIGYTPTVSRIYANSKMVLKGYVFGLFGIVQGNVTIKNVVFENVAITGAYYDSTKEEIVKAEIDSVGAAIGYVNETAGNLVVENVKVLSGSITASNAAAGIVGRFYNTGTALFKDVENHANMSILAEGTHAGGIAGFGGSSEGIEFINAKNYGNITAATGETAGGILNGDVALGAKLFIIDSSNFGTISGTSILYTESTDHRYGLVGNNGRNIPEANITNSFNFGTVK